MFLLLWPVSLMSSASESRRSKPSSRRSKRPGTDSVVLADGCFWGMQGIFEHMKGVTNTVVGYAGGTKETAHYDMVADRNTAHAEAIKVTWDQANDPLRRTAEGLFHGGA